MRDVFIVRMMVSEMLRRATQLFLFLSLLCFANIVLAQGLLLPNGMQQFVDANGAPLASGQVYFYIPSTTTPKATYLNAAETVQNTNPVALDAAGRAIIWGSGAYRQVVFDQFGNQIWDQITSIFDASSLDGQTLNNITLAGTTHITGPATAVTPSCNDNSTSIATTAFVNCAFGSALLSKSVLLKTASYSVAVGDDAKIVELQGSSANQTLTVPTLAALKSNFSIGVCNQGSHLWTIASVDAGSLRLYPGTCNILQSNGSALRFMQPFQRGHYSTLFVGPSGSCADTNDGLSADNSGQICHFNEAIRRLQAEIDTDGTSAQIVPSTGTYTENVFFAGYIQCCGDQISINPSGDIIVLNGGSGATFGTRDGGVLTLVGDTHLFEIGCTGGVGALATQYSTIDTLSVTIASCNGGNAFGADDTGHLNISGTTTFNASNAVTLFTVGAAGSLVTLAGTVNFSAGTTDSFVFEAIAGGVLRYEGGPVAWTNTGNLSGAAQYVVETAGGLATAGQLGAIPGSAGSVTAPGWAQ